LLTQNNMHWMYFYATCRTIIVYA